MREWFGCRWLAKQIVTVVWHMAGCLQSFALKPAVWVTDSFVIKTIQFVSYTLFGEKNVAQTVTITPCWGHLSDHACKPSNAYKWGWGRKQLMYDERWEFTNHSRNNLELDWLAAPGGMGKRRFLSRDEEMCAAPLAGAAHISVLLFIPVEWTEI